jgi:hypothetical protein
MTGEIEGTAFLMHNKSHLFDKLEFVNTYYHKDIYLKFSFVFPNIL